MLKFLDSSFKIMSERFRKLLFSKDIKVFMIKLRKDRKSWYVKNNQINVDTDILLKNQKHTLTKLKQWKKR